MTAAKTSEVSWLQGSRWPLVGVCLDVRHSCSDDFQAFCMFALCTVALTGCCQHCFAFHDGTGKSCYGKMITLPAACLTCCIDSNTKLCITMHDWTITDSISQHEHYNRDVNDFQSLNSCPTREKLKLRHRQHTCSHISHRTAMLLWIYRHGQEEMHFDNTFQGYKLQHSGGSARTCECVRQQVTEQYTPGTN